MPYTIGLLGSIPRLDGGRGQPLTPIEGVPPSLVDLPPGCPFAPRCPVRIEICSEVEPDSRARSVPRHAAACHRSARHRVGRTSSAPASSRPSDVALSDARAAGRGPQRRRRARRSTDVARRFPLRKGAVFRRTVGAVHAVDGISFDIREGETLGLVGESGCGKTTTIMEILGLAPPQQGKIVVLGRSAERLRGDERMKVRRDMQVVFQDPMASLDPRLPVSDILAEPLRTHGVPVKRRDARVRELLEIVGLDPKLHLSRFPGEFSGGQRQRIGIARALALEPRLIVLDEPVSALDVSIQAGVLNLLERLKTELGLSYLFVAHDLSVVRHIADRVAVMYLGRIVEIGEVDTVFERPSHPYTQALLSAIPLPDPPAERARRRDPAHRRPAQPGQPAVGLPVPVALPAARHARRIRQAALHRRRPAVVSGPDG